MPPPISKITSRSVVPIGTSIRPTLLNLARQETIKLTIDNRTAEVAPGTNLVEAAASIGIKIPTLCYLNLHELGCKNDPVSAASAS